VCGKKSISWCIVEAIIILDHILEEKHSNNSQSFNNASCKAFYRTPVGATSTPLSNHGSKSEFPQSEFFLSNSKLEFRAIPCQQIAQQVN
jgi:hypothetical protein